MATANNAATTFNRGSFLEAAGGLSVAALPLGLDGVFTPLRPDFFPGAWKVGGTGMAEDAGITGGTGITGGAGMAGTLGADDPPSTCSPHLGQNLAVGFNGASHRVQGAGIAGAGAPHFRQNFAVLEISALHLLHFIIRHLLITGYLKLPTSAPTAAGTAPSGTAARAPALR
jgi:hypothetical protein